MIIKKINNFLTNTSRHSFLINIAETIIENNLQNKILKFNIF